MCVDNKLGTLGNACGYISCSMHVARKKYKDYEIVPFSTFEEAALDLKKKKLSSILVPAAYSKISEFIMDRELIVKEVFIAPIPPLVCVSRFQSDTIQIRKIYLHEATYKLLEEVVFIKEGVEMKYVNSNIEACKYLLNDESQNSISITNKLCADYYNLNIVKTLRDTVLMPWIIFKRKVM